MRTKRATLALRVSLGYCVVAGAWILISDRLLARLSSEPGQTAFLQTAKGWAFVLVTGSFLYLALRNQLRRLEKESARRTEAEALSHEPERRLATLTRNLPGLSYRCRNDKDFTTEYVSDGVAELTGYPASDFRERRRHFGQLIHPEDREAVGREIEAAIREKRPFEMTYRIRAASGAARWVWERGSAVFDGGGAVEALEGFVTDVTVRKEAEETLREVHERLLTIIATTPGIVCSFRLRPDGSACFPFGAERIGEIYGISPDRLAEDASGIFDRIHPKDIGGLRESIEASARELRLWQYEWRVCHPTRGELWIEARSMPVREPDGSTLWHGVVTDITARKQAEQDRQKFVMLADSSSDFIGMCDLEFTPQYVNPAGMRMVGLPDREAACGVKVKDYFFPEDQQFITEEFFPRVLRKGHGEVEIRLRHFQSGEPIWILYYVFSVRDSAGEVVGWATVSRDITERRQAEGALRESELRLRQATMAANVGLWDWDLQANTLWFSPEWKKQIGCEGEEISNSFQEWQSRVHPDDLQPALEKVRRYLEKPWPNFENEFRFRHKDGSYLWILAQASLVADAAGKPVRMLGSHLDISELKRAEQHIRRLNRVYAFLSDINQTIVREEDSKAMLEAACRIAVEKGKFRMAWIGLRALPEWRISLAAHAGADEETLRILGAMFGRDAREDACAFTAHALQTGQHGVCNDIVGDARAASWREQALQRGYRAMASLPLKAGETVIGIFNLYASDPDFFDEDELRLLDELASDISFALEVSRRNRQREATEERLARQRGALIALTGQWIPDGGDTTDGLRQITESAARTLNVARASIWLLKPDHSEIRCLDLFEAGAERHSGGAALAAATHPAYFRALAEVEVIAADDAVNDPRTREFAADYLEPLKIGAMLDVPIHVGGKLHGVLCCEHTGSPRQWTGDEQTFAVAMAHLVSLAVEGAERRQAEGTRDALLKLGTELSVISDPIEAARCIFAAADRLWAFDAGVLEVYLPEEDLVRCILNLDLVDGTRREVEGTGSVCPPSARFRRILSQGGELILRQPPVQAEPDAMMFGDTARPSASILSVPIRWQEKAVGVLSVQSYTPNAFSERDRWTLQGLADHCGGALERIRSDEALRASEERFRELAQTVEEVFWMTDPAKNRMLYISPAYEKIWGRTCASLYESPRDWLAPVHPEDRQRIAEAAETKQTRGEYDETYRIQRPDGAWRWIRDRAFPIVAANGEVLRIVGTAEDITERRQLEQQLRQAQKMEAIGQLAGGVAHDFNNILAVILMQADLTATSPDLPEEAQEGLQQIREAAERAANLTRQLLLFSRKQVMQRRDLDLNEAVTSLAKMLQRIIGEDVQLQLILNPRPLVTHADGAMLDQVLMNLVVNARDAMPGGGKLVIETLERSFTEADAQAIPDAAAGRHVCLSVTDTGSGIAPEILTRLFEPFFTTKEPGKGTGLGLATVFGIVKQHRGWVSVQSEAGKGTTFQVFLPAKESGSSADEARQQPAPRGGSETILLVEDEPAVRALTRTVLERRGYRVLEAASGREALTVWDRNKAAIQLLFTDLILPEGVSGRELAARLRQSNPDLPVIFTSGYSSEIAGRGLSLEKGQRFVQKPGQASQLLDAVRKCLDEAGRDRG